MEKIIWKNEKRKLSELKPAEYNPRKYTPKQKADLGKSIEKFGTADPIICNADGTIIGGHFRFKILLEKYGPEYEVDVRLPEKQLSEQKEKELNLRLNKNLGQWENGLLQIFDEVLLKEVGFESKEIDLIIKTKTEDDEIRKPEKEIVKKGEIWKLGNHKLICGDASMKINIESLMGSERADMMFTDPPYGVNYGEKNRFLNSFQRAGRNLRDVANDMIGKDALFKILNSAFLNAWEYGSDHCSYYVTAPQGGELGLMMMMMMMSNLSVRHILIWKKNRAGFSLGRLDYEYKHEPILFTWKKTHKFYGAGIKQSIWEFDKEIKCDLHPTMKPVALIENAIINSSQRGDLLIDFFAGSGSTIIAAEKTHRKCYAVEIEPHYCDIIIGRWEKYTNKKAELLEK